MQIGNNMIIPVDANSEITVEFFILKMQLKKALISNEMW